MFLRHFPLLVFCCTRWAAADPARWSDPSIPLMDGLELWLDASRENEAREAHYMNRLGDGDHSEFWHDSSGHGRHLNQWDAGARPEWRAASFRFDGDDSLAALVTPSVEYKEGTVFIVAAPEKANESFAAFFSAARRGENDYTSGWNVDLGADSSGAKEWTALNVEGAGERGAQNLLTKPVSLGVGHILAVRNGDDAAELRVDGVTQGSRPRGKVAWSMDRVAVGARFVEPAMRHHLAGRIAEVLVFSRRLNDSEVSRVEKWLMGKQQAFLRPPDVDPATLSRLVAVKDGPPLQMLVPGFTVRELPVKVTSLNNVEYGPDGRLFAAGYDGRFHLLRDTDGDGLEDKVETFSPETSDDYPIGLVVKDGMPHALLADEIVRFRDTNGDGIPDQRETVHRGWDDPALRSDPLIMHRRVDSALALAAGEDGSWYVTMGSANPGNGYWQKALGDIWAPNTRKVGPPMYSPDKLRGCLLRITPDGKVERLASGLRYIMSLQWNEYGDLFGTDQEGATWLPNGNPFDELLHIQTGRHYGFPPRHPELLPGVVDEPSTFDYGPQHESTCGFRFNGPTGGHARFGPELWAHDALVTGESRGKLWRTRLARTEAGYVAQTELIARFGLLLLDCTLAPNGDLVVCCHAGPPDWGNGPSAIGRLFKISYSVPQEPLPVLTWPQSETQTVVAFDRPLDRARWKDLTNRLTIEAGRFVDAADRLEVIRPGYAVVRLQQNEPRYSVAVKSARIGDDQRSMIIESEPREKAVNYALTIAGGQIGNEGSAKVVRQMDTVDLVHNLTGVAVEWRGREGAAWQGWLPHPDFVAARSFTKASPVHDQLWEDLESAGTLTLRGQLNLFNMLQAATQPGSKLDYEPAPEVVTVSYKSDAPLEIEARGARVERISERESRLTVTSRDGVWVPVKLTLSTPARKLDVNFTTNLDRGPRPLALTRMVMPFAKPPGAYAKAGAIPEIAGGDWTRGQKLFMGKATCFTCHQINGQGFAVGPDLSNTHHRDYASVLRDLQEPSATINPDAVAYTVIMKDGTAAVGTRIGETNTELKLASPGGGVTALRKVDIEKKEALPTSLMPPGLLEILTPDERKDLLAFLLGEPPRADGKPVDGVR